MKLSDLFQNAMRLTRELDCQHFADDAAYRKGLESELCGEMTPNPARTDATDKAAAETKPWALSH